MSAAKKRIFFGRLPRFERRVHLAHFCETSAHDNFPPRQHFARDGAGGDSHRGFARRRASAAAMVADAVFLQISKIRVSGAESAAQIVVIARLGVGVADENANGRAGGFSFKDAGDDFGAVGFAPLRHISRCAGAAAVQIALHIVFGKGNAGRTAVYDASQRRAVAFAESADAKQFSESIARHCESITAIPPAPIPRKNFPRVSFRANTTSAEVELPESGAGKKHLHSGGMRGIFAAAVYNSAMLSVPAVFAVLGINAIFGGAYLFGKLGVEHFPPFLFAAMRFALVAVALAPFLRFNRALRAHWRPVLGFCLTMGIGVYGTMYWALYLADDASAVLIGTQFSTPAAVLLGALLLGERASRAVWGGIALTMAGVLLVGFDAAALGYPLAFALVLASALFYAYANVLSRGLRESGLGLLNLNALMALASAPPMLALSFAWGEPWRAPILAAGAAEWTTILYSALAVSLAGHVGLFRLLRHYPLSAVMPFYVFTPIFGVAGAILFLGESPTPRFAAGALLAIFGIVAINRFHRRAAAGA